MAIAIPDNPANKCAIRVTRQKSARHTKSLKDATKSTLVIQPQAPFSDSAVGDQVLQGQ
jgi:hypothetical protein